MTGKQLLAERDRLVAALETDPRCDGTPDSLLALEGWYFELYKAKAFRKTALGTRDAFERAMGFYFGAVAVAHAKAKWIVEELGTGPEIGLVWGRGMSKILGIDALCEDWHRRPSNKQQRALYRTYCEHWPIKKKR